MNILVDDKDLSESVKTITWSGDSGQIARKLESTIAKNTQDPDSPNVTINEGDQALLQTDMGTLLFGGIIFDIEKMTGSNLVRYLAYDLIFYLAGSELTKDYNGAPEDIARDICRAFGIIAGTMAVTGITTTNPCVKKTGYQVIQSSYAAAARKNGKKYQLIMTEVNRVSVIEKGQDSGVILTGDSNLSGATYKTTLQNLVNKVLVINQEGAVVGIVEDTESQTAYGTIQKVLEQEEGKDAAAEAKNLLRESDPSTTVTEIPDDTRAMAGYALLAQEEKTGLISQFFIESDSHKYSGGEFTMSPILTFQNLMNEVEIDKPSENKKQKRGG